MHACIAYSQHCSNELRAYVFPFHLQQMGHRKNKLTQNVCWRERGLAYSTAHIFIPTPLRGTRSGLQREHCHFSGSRLEFWKVWNWESCSLALAIPHHPPLSIQGVFVCIRRRVLSRRKLSADMSCCRHCKVPRVRVCKCTCACACVCVCVCMCVYLSSSVIFAVLNTYYILATLKIFCCRPDTVCLLNLTVGVLSERNPKAMGLW